MTRFLVRVGMPTAAVACLIYGAYHVHRHTRPQPRLLPITQPASTIFAKTVAAVGVIEPRSENIAVGTSLPGLVESVQVRAGQKVRSGDPLFRVDERAARAALELRRAELDQARAQLDRLLGLPRSEELPEARALVAECEARLAEKLDLYRRGKALLERNSLSVEEVTIREQAHRTSQAQLDQAQAKLELLQAGAWKHDIAVAQSALRKAEADLQRAETDVERLTVRSPIDASVLRVDVRPGEYVGTEAGERSLIVLGDVEVLHVRAEIDEEDIGRFPSSAKAVAQARGETKSHALRLVRIEPLVVSKEQLTGDGHQRVDVRVLQAIFAFEKNDAALYVGRQVDVFIDASSDAVASDANLADL